MSVSENYLSYVLDQLEYLGTVTTKKMFGGVGIYLDGVFFGGIDNNILYFRVDDSNRPDYESAGMNPFRPYGENAYAMQYYEVPADVLEDKEKLRLWADKALAVAIRKASVGRKQKT